MNSLPVLQKLTAVGWILLVAVLYGGESLLGFLTGRGTLTEHQQQFFRAGHGHAGVLSIVGILYSLCLTRTDLSTRTAVTLWVIYATGVFAVAGGLFMHAFMGDPGKFSQGILLTTIGAVAIGISVIGLAIGLWRAA